MDTEARLCWRCPRFLFLGYFVYAEEELGMAADFHRRIYLRVDGKYIIQNMRRVAKYNRHRAK